MTLVVIDVAAGERGLIQMPDQRLLLQRQLVEAVRIQLNDGRIVDLLEQIGASSGVGIGSDSIGRSTF